MSNFDESKSSLQLQDFGVDIQSAAERLNGEREERLATGKSLIRYGLPYLDQALEGMRKNDLLLVGAPSGGGKTEFVSSMARANVERGRRVFMFALEAESREIERRILYKYIAKAFFADPHRPKVFLSYRQWLLGNVDHQIEKYETEAQRIFVDKYKNLFTVYRKRDFTIEDFERNLMLIKDRADLVILDHLSYFDFDESKSENQAVTAVVKKIRDLALLTGVPVVLVAHLRKKNQFQKTLTPGLEDFFGSSNVYKICTQAVILSPAQTGDVKGTTREWPTYVRVAKDRVEGSTTRYLARTSFNADTNEYAKDFILGFFREGADKFEPFQSYDDYPHWARPKAARS